MRLIPEMGVLVLMLSTTVSAVAPALAATNGVVDEYGLLEPNYPCPVVSASAKEHGGQSWLAVPEPSAAWSIRG